MSLEMYLYRKLRKSKREIKRLRRHIKDRAGWGGYYFRLADELQTELNKALHTITEMSDEAQEANVKIESLTAEVERLRKEMHVALSQGIAEDAAKTLREALR
jgi:hypothetical protein